MRVIYGICLGYFIGLGFAFASGITEQSKGDSIIVKFGKNTHLIIIGENRNELEKLLQYDINKLLRDIRVRIDSTNTDTTIIYSEFDTNKYLTDREGTDQNYIRIGANAGEKKVEEPEIAEQDLPEVDDSDISYIEKIRKNGFYGPSIGGSPRKGFEFGIGFNRYGSIAPDLSYSKEDYRLRSFRARYIEVGYVASTNIVESEKARISLDLGASFSWYNLMFNADKTIDKNDDKIEFVNVLDMDGNVVALKKSKLVLPYINLSFMPTISFPHAFISYVSAGMYGGYRLGGYTKVRNDGSKDVNHDRRDFFVNEFRYGISSEIGIRKFLKLFIHYDINELFKTNKGPQVRMLSFGIKL